MSRAEKFISDCTRNCSNEMESPLYVNPKLNFYPWLTPDQALRAIEIAKEELLNEVCEWLKKNVTYTHPRKGTKECLINIAKLKDDLKDE